MYTLWALALTALFLAAWSRPRKRYPPGPKRYPLIGNLLDIPRRHAYKKFAELSKQLDSDIIYLDAAGKPFIVLNSLEACNDLLEKRSAIYSSRYHQTMLYELLGGKRLFAMSPYGEHWRESRRIMTKHITARENQEPIFLELEKFIRRSLLPNMLASPTDYINHIQNAVGGTIISLAYGLPIKRAHDPWIKLTEQAMQCITSAAVPGKYAVDVIPALRYLPDWFPGAGFKKEAKEWKQVTDRFLEEPFAAVANGMVDGSVQNSFVSRSLEDIAGAPDKEHLECIIQGVGGMFLAGGVDTSVTAIVNIIVALLLHPEVQVKVQAEIDCVIGRQRLPVLPDKAQLPYLTAVVKESLRWKPVVPTGLPHMTSEDDIYRGYFIPKGSIVMGNSWAFMHNEEIFPDPSTFDPTRFLAPSGQLNLDKNIPDPEVVGTFGFGRRGCPGNNIALASIWLTAACIVACFDISPEFNDVGEPVLPEIEYVGKEIVSHPEPFKCRITPRHSEAVSLIQAEYDETSEYI